MKHLNLFTSTYRDTLVKARKGESKFGEHIQLLPNLTNIYDSISNLDVDYVVFGVKEDIGVYANYGKRGTYRAWEVALKFLLNTQSNSLNKANRVLILGCLDFTSESDAIFSSGIKSKKQVQKAREMVEIIDKEVTYLVSTIIRTGKTPIVVGGGHNNCYGTIKGTALALNKKINAVNLDAHSDFRPEEGRHSGNGFSYAFAEGFLKNYFILGLQENYTSDKLFKTINKLKEIQYLSFEDIEIRNLNTFEEGIDMARQHICNRPFGIEIDCDSIENIPSSASTPSGFSVNQARRFTHVFGSIEKASYLHICEAAPKKKTEKAVGKLISYLITDFMRSKNSK